MTDWGLFYGDFSACTFVLAAVQCRDHKGASAFLLLTGYIGVAVHVYNVYNGSGLSQVYFFTREKLVDDKFCGSLQLVAGGRGCPGKLNAVFPLVAVNP